MANVKLGIGIQNQMSRELDKINKELSLMQRNLDVAQGKGDKLSNINLKTMTSGIGNANIGVQSLKGQIAGLNDKVEKTGNGFSGWSKAIIVANQAVGLISAIGRGVGSVLGVSDTYMQTNARLGLINDGLRTNKELQDQIYASAERSRASYTDTADSIAKMGLLAPEAFKNNDELIKFTELINKSSKISGASGADTSGAMRQLTQGLSAGALRGDEFNSVAENLPMVKNAIAEYMGLSTGALRAVAAEGKITSEIIKEAMLASGDKIELMFESIPMTFGDSMTALKNILGRMVGEVGSKILPKVQEFMLKLTEIISSAQVQQFLVGIAVLILYLGDLLLWSMEVASKVFNFIIDNWPTVSTLLVLGLIALATYWGIVGAKAILAGIQMFLATIPVLWPLYLIIGIIMLILGALRMLGVSWADIFGYIGGILGAFVAFVFNFIILPIWNKFAIFANFLGNVFTDPVYSIKKLFVDLLNTILEIVNSVANVIDKVLGTNWSSSIQGFQKDMTDWLGTSEKYKEFVPELKAMDFEKSFDVGYNIGSGIGSGIDKLTGDLSNLMKGTDTAETAINKGSVPVKVTGGSLDSAGEVDVSDEDLKMLKDLASKDFMVNYKQVIPTMSVTFGDIRETADVNLIKRIIEKMTEEELANMYLEEVTVQ